MNKKGIFPLMSLVFVGLLVLGVWVVASGKLNIGKTLSVSTADEPKPSADQVASCDGVASVKLLYDSLNYYKQGTDPSGNLTIYEVNGKKFKKMVADDATSTTGPVLSRYKAIAGNNAGTPISGYFSAPADFSTDCSDLDIQPRLYQSNAPTLTILNDDGVTKNSDSNHEAMDASSTYSPCMTVKAPAEKCSSVYGAYVIFETDATYILKVDSTDLESADAGYYFAHTTNQSASALDFDQYKIFKWDGGKLCDGDKVDICFDVTTSASTPGEDQANIQIHWRALNYDTDADEGTPIGPAIYDEDLNLIDATNTTTFYYTA